MLTLYYRPTCPFCRKVFDYTEEAGISFDLKNISSNPEFIPELIEKGGKKQVPYLVDSDREIKMYESDDIIKYLRNRIESQHE